MEGAGSRLAGIGLRVVVLVAGFLLFSMGGGAVFGAPVTLPLLVVALRSPLVGHGWKVAAGVVAGFTVGQCAFAAVFAVQGDAQPLVWLVPLIAVLATWLLAARTLR